MSLIIDDPDIEALAYLLSAITGESVEDAVAKAIQDRIDALPEEPDKTGVSAEDLLEIGRRCAALPVIDDRGPAELVGYDDRGLPR